MIRKRTVEIGHFILRIWRAGKTVVTLKLPDVDGGINTTDGEREEDDWKWWHDKDDIQWE